jgi:X-X-X-Leu-X-X-Gly heptad repeat protein
MEDAGECGVRMANPLQVASRGVSEATAGLQEAAQGARALIDGAVDLGRRRLELVRRKGWDRSAREVVEWVRAQPIIALSLAAGVAVLLGWLATSPGARR